MLELDFGTGGSIAVHCGLGDVACAEGNLLILMLGLGGSGELKEWVVGCGVGLEGGDGHSGLRCLEKGLLALWTVDCDI